MRLNELSDNPGASKNKKRKARGPSSGNGKTAGRGHKGQKSRSGTSMSGYEGGQMPLYQRLPKRGMRAAKKFVCEVKTCEISRIIQRKGASTSVLIPETLLYRKRKSVFRQSTVKLISSSGDIHDRYIVYVHRISSGARHEIEKVGGRVFLVANNFRAWTIKNNTGKDVMRVVTYTAADEAAPAVNQMFNFVVDLIIDKGEVDAYGNEIVADEFVFSFMSAASASGNGNFRLPSNPAEVSDNESIYRLRLPISYSGAGKHDYSISCAYKNSIIGSDQSSFLIDG